MKDPPTMIERIRRSLKERPQTHHELIRSVLGDGYSYTAFGKFSEAWAYMKSPPCEVACEQTQVPGTGHEGPPVFEHVWRILPR